MGSLLATNHFLKTLDLSENNISDEGGNALAHALKSNNSLTFLNLYKNKINEPAKSNILNSWHGKIPVNWNVPIFEIVEKKTKSNHPDCTKDDAVIIGFILNEHYKKN